MTVLFRCMPFSCYLKRRMISELLQNLQLEYKEKKREILIFETSASRIHTSKRLVSHSMPWMWRTSIAAFSGEGRLQTHKHTSMTPNTMTWWACSDRFSNGFMTDDLLYSLLPTKYIPSSGRLYGWYSRLYLLYSSSKIIFSKLTFISLKGFLAFSFLMFLWHYLCADSITFELHHLCDTDYICLLHRTYVYFRQHAFRQDEFPPYTAPQKWSFPYILCMPTTFQRLLAKMTETQGTVTPYRCVRSVKLQ